MTPNLSYKSLHSNQKYYRVCIPGIKPPCTGAWSWRAAKGVLNQMCNSCIYPQMCTVPDKQADFGLLCVFIAPFLTVPCTLKMRYRSQDFLLLVQQVDKSHDNQGILSNKAQVTYFCWTAITPHKLAQIESHIYAKPALMYAFSPQENAIDLTLQNFTHDIGVLTKNRRDF